jgi:hypothetical protein
MKPTRQETKKPPNPWNEAMRYAASFVTGMLTCLLVACSPNAPNDKQTNAKTLRMEDPEAEAVVRDSGDSQAPAKKPRPLDAGPIKTRLKTPLPPGRAEASFEFYSGRDPMVFHVSVPEADLVVTVRVGADEYQQTIARCSHPKRGSALGRNREREIDDAICSNGGEYRLITEPGSLVVMRMDKKPDGEVIAHFDLPDGVRAAPLQYEKSAKTPRPLDAKPIKTRLKTPLPPGRAEASFKFNTGGDQMTLSPSIPEAGLMVVVRVESDLYEQTIASCADPSAGTALGGGTERELNVAICNGEYWLITEPGSVAVMRMDRKSDGELITRFDLPAGVRAIYPENHINMKTPRPLDAKPIKTHLEKPLPPGRAEAFFKLDTSGDQMTLTSFEAGLIVVVRVGADQYQQTIASCPEPSLGSALGGGTERELEIAFCNGEFWLIAELGSVAVMRMDRKSGGELIARFDLPAGVKAVSADNK